MLADKALVWVLFHEQNDVVFQEKKPRRIILCSLYSLIKASISRQDVRYVDRSVDTSMNKAGKAAKTG